MKITKSRLKQIITEELHNILAEQEDDDGPGSTQYLKPGEREAMRKKRAGAETKAIDWMRQAVADQRARAAADRRARGEIRQRAEKLLDVLYPDASNQELLLTIVKIADDGTITRKESDDEATLVDSLFGFLLPHRMTHDKPNPFLMDRAEEWIGMFKNPQNAALKVGGRSNSTNLNSLLTYIEKRSMDIGKPKFAKAKADAESRGPARNVPVGKAATPGTPERAALDRLMKFGSSS